MKTAPDKYNMFYFSFKRPIYTCNNRAESKRPTFTCNNRAESKKWRLWIQTLHKKNEVFITPEVSLQ